MRTTIDILDPIMQEIKAIVVLEGKSLKTFILEAINQELRNRKNPKKKRNRVKLPLVPSKNPASLNITSDTIANVLQQEDLHELQTKQ